MRRAHLAPGALLAHNGCGGQAAVTALLQLFPGRTYASDSEYAEYLADARVRVRQARDAAPPRAPPALRAPDAATASTADAADDDDDEGHGSAALQVGDRAELWAAVVV